MREVITPLSRLWFGVAAVVLTTSPAAASSTAVEYFHRDYGHYFVTALPKEIAALDAGVFFGWSRTGLSFDVLAVDEASSANVCRFWSGQTFVTKSSHFYTPFDWECAIVKRNRDWVYEGLVFSMMLPDVAGACSGRNVPLYRLYNNGQTGAPNHRYTTSPAVRSQMLAQGWVAEGSGVGVIGCVPPGPPVSVTINSPTTSPSVGDFMQETAMVRDAAGAVIPGAAPTWTSSNPGIAAISSTGLLQAHTTGTVVVTATINGVSATESLTITPAMRVSVTVGTTKDVVFSYVNDHCDDPTSSAYAPDFPDQIPRVVRAEDGSLVLFAGDAPRYYVSRGADFDSFKRDCGRPVLLSPDLRTPESYENLEWLWAVYREGSRWHAFIDNEFHDAAASTCRPGDPTPANPCWYNSVTHGVSTDGARSFTKPLAPAHVVAPPPNVWVPPSFDTPTSTIWPGKFFEGYQPPSNVFRALDGFYYASLFLLPSKSDPYGWRKCGIRTDRLDDPASWRAWDGSGFNLRLTSPYVTGRPGPLCANLYGLLGDYYNTYLERYIQVGMGVQMIEGRKVCGVYFQLSANLFIWSPPQLIIEAIDDRCQVDPQKPGLLEPVRVMFAALIDHADTTVNFERPGRTPYLYYVRFNDEGVNRDVVRVPLTFTRID